MSNELFETIGGREAYGWEFRCTDASHFHERQYLSGDYDHRGALLSSRFGRSCACGNGKLVLVKTGPFDQARLMFLDEADDN